VSARTHADTGDTRLKGRVRNIPEHTWTTLDVNLGVEHHNRGPFPRRATHHRPTLLAVLWKQRHRRADEFATNTTASATCSS